MSIKLAMEIQRAHERIDKLQETVDADAKRELESTMRVEKLEGELRALKARMGKTREVAEI